MPVLHRHDVRGRRSENSNLMNSQCIWSISLGCVSRPVQIQIHLKIYTPDHMELIVNVLSPPVPNTVLQNKHLLDTRLYANWGLS
jgi:hypothetical protein